MTRYVVTCNHTGIIAGDKETGSPAEACRLLDADIGMVAASYDEHPGHSAAARDAEVGYLVYVAPDGYDFDNFDEAISARMLAPGAVPYVKAGYAD